MGSAQIIPGGPLLYFTHLQRPFEQEITKPESYWTQHEAQLRMRTMQVQIPSGKVRKTQPSIPARR